MLPARTACLLILPLGLLSSCGSDEAFVEPLPARALEPPFDHQASGAVAARLEELRREVAELGPDHRWAGEYYFGDGLGVNVTLVVAPSGYAYTWRGCLGVYGQRQGTLRLENDRLWLSSTRDPGEPLPGLEAELLIVRWGASEYLLTPEQAEDLRRFAEDGEWRVSMVSLLRRGEENALSPDSPEIPD